MPRNGWAEAMTPNSMLDGMYTRGNFPQERSDSGIVYIRLLGHIFWRYFGSAPNRANVEGDVIIRYCAQRFPTSAELPRLEFTTIREFTTIESFNARFEGMQVEHVLGGNTE